MKSDNVSARFVPVLAKVPKPPKPLVGAAGAEAVALGVVVEVPKLAEPTSWYMRKSG